MGAIAVAVVVVGAASIFDGNRSDGSTTPQEAGETASHASTTPFDSVPGLGRSIESRTRDDAIALWEAYQREASMVGCTTRGGFNYFVDLRAGDSDLASAAEVLGLRSDPAKVPDGSERNAQEVASLDAKRKDAYHLALFGVSWAELSNERGDVMREGCFAEALAAVPGVWRLKDSLAAERAELLAAATDDAVKAGAGAEFAACAKGFGVVANNQAELESRENDPELIDSVVSACSPAYEEKKAAALVKREQEFLDSHPETLAQIERYRDVVDQMRADEGFVTAIGAA